MQINVGDTQCPLCKQRLPFDANPEWLLTYFTYTKKSKRTVLLLKALMKARKYHKALSATDLVVAMYENVSAEKIPVGSMTELAATLRTANKELYTLGWTIVGPNTTGKGYYLVPLV